MSGIHTSCRQGKRVKLLFKDGRPPVITKFEQEKGRVIHTKAGTFKIADLRALIIYKPTDHERDDNPPNN